MRRLLLVPVVALVVAGCASGGSSGLGAATSAQQVITAMGKHGMPCTNVQPNTGVIGVREEVGCTVEGHDATVDVWNSNAERDTMTKAFASLATGITVYGDKWSVNVDTDAEAHKIAAAIGGTVH